MYGTCVQTYFTQHTFSIVAVDTMTGEIGSAGATCGDSIIWPGTWAYIISDILPGLEQFIHNLFGLHQSSKCESAHATRFFTDQSLIGWCQMMYKTTPSQGNMEWWIIKMDLQDQLHLQVLLVMIIKIIF